MEVSDIPWIKIFITLISITIALLEVWDFKKKESKNWKKLFKTKKFLIIILFVPLILMSIWDTTKESIDISKADKKNDSINRLRTDRAEKLLRNVENSFNGITDTRDEILQVDSILNLVKDSLQSQVVLLKVAIEKSKELEKIERRKFIEGQPNITIYSKDTKISYDDLANIKIEFTYANSGKRTAKNIRYISRAILVDVANQEILSMDRKIGSPEIRKFNEMPPVSADSYKTYFPLYTKFTKEKFVDNDNYWIVLTRFFYEDGFDLQFNKLIILSGFKFNGSNFTMGEMTKENIPNHIMDFLEKRGESQLFFDQSFQLDN